MSIKQYSVKTPKRIQFGDPEYWQKYKTRKLHELVADIKVPNDFETVVALDKNPVSCDNCIRMSITCAPKDTIKMYLIGRVAEDTEFTFKHIGVTSNEYIVKVDGAEQGFTATPNCFYGEHLEFTELDGSKRVVLAEVLQIELPESVTVESAREIVNSMFVEVEQIK